ncbi:MAG: type I 3-dehydroquinate dehydratase [Nitrosopumilaceae archaeon]
MAYKTCVTIAEKTPQKLSQVVKKATKKSNYVEIRFDFLIPSQVPESLELVKKYLNRSVCTLRPKSEGGKFSGSENERISILKLIAEYNPFLLDIEYNTLRKNKQFTNYIKKTRTDLLVSWHDFKKTPSDSFLSKILNKMTKFSKNIKIVTTAKSTNDSSRVLSLYNNAQKLNLIAFSMGEYGKMSRILCLFLGSPYTYVSLERPIAPGQFSLDEIKSIIKI